MKRIILLIVVFSAPTPGEDLPVKGQGAIPFWVDRAGFYDSDSLNYGELYLQFLCKDLTFKQSDDHRLAIYKVEASFYSHPNPDSTQIVEHAWEKQIVIDIKKVPTQNRIGTNLLGFALYKVTTRI